MNKLLTGFFCLVSTTAFAASPAFGDFNTNQFSVTGNKVAVKSGALFTNMPYVGSNMAVNIIPNSGRTSVGATPVSYSPDFSGDGAGLAGLPTTGNPIWSNQKRPMVVISSKDPLANNLELCTESNAWISIESFKTNHLLGFTTNLGIRVAYDCENGWLTNHRKTVIDSTAKVRYILAWNTNRFPGATTNPTNVTKMARTNNIDFGLMMYFDTVNPTNTGNLVNTECDLNPISGANNYWHYPNGPNNLGAVEIQPIITGNSVDLDMATFQSWGVSMFTGQDGGDYYQFAGYQDTMRRKFAYAMLYPWYMVYDNTTPTIIQGAYQSWTAPPFPAIPSEHGMILNYLISTPVYYWPMSVEYEANGVCFGSNGHSQEPAGSGVLGATIGNIRPQIYFLTNIMENTIHPILQADTLFNPEDWSYVDWRNHMSFVAMFGCDLWLGMPHQEYMNDLAFSLNYTNICTNGVWQNFSQHRPVVLDLGLTNGMIARRLDDPTEWAVLFYNESPSVSTNKTFNFASLGYSNYFAFARHVRTNSFIGIVSNSFTISVSPTNTEWVKFKFSAGNVLANRITLTNGVVLAPNDSNPLITDVISASGVTIMKMYDTGEAALGPGAITVGVILELWNKSGQEFSLGFNGLYRFGRNGTDGRFHFNGTQTGATGFTFETNGFPLLTISGLLGMNVRPLATFTNGLNALAASSIPTNTAAGNTITNDIVVGAKTTARNQRFSIAVSAFGTATLANGVDASLVVSNASDGKILTQKFSIPAGVLATYTITNELCIPDADPLSIYWLTNCSIVPGTTVITYK